MASLAAYSAAMDIETQSVQDRCAKHPERAARACARCGTFVCEACRIEGREPTVCSACQARLEGGRFVSQVPLFGIGLMVHGGLAIGLGGLLAFYGALLAFRFDRVAPSAANEEIVLLASGMLGIGLLHVIVGGLQIWAGWRVRQYRSRLLTLGALTAGLTTVIGCYCAPTALAMLIWGAVILQSRDVVARFEHESGVLR